GGAATRPPSCDPTRRSSDLMTNQAASGHAAPHRSWAGRPPTRLHDPVDVPLLADMLSARDTETAWTTLRKRWGDVAPVALGSRADRKSTRLNSSHVKISYAV